MAPRGGGLPLLFPQNASFLAPGRSTPLWNVEGHNSIELQRSDTFLAVKRYKTQIKSLFPHPIFHKTPNLESIQTLHIMKKSRWSLLFLVQLKFCNGANRTHLTLADCPANHCRQPLKKQFAGKRERSHSSFLRWLEEILFQTSAAWMGFK